MTHARPARRFTFVVRVDANGHTRGDALDIVREAIRATALHGRNGGGVRVSSYLPDFAIRARDARDQLIRDGYIPPPAAQGISEIGEEQ